MGIRDLFRFDSWSSAFTGFGDVTRDPLAESEWVASTRLTQVQIEELVRSNGIASRICDLPAFDATRAGFDLELDGEPLDDLESALDALPCGQRHRGAMRAIRKSIRWARQYGGAAILLGTQDSAPSLADPLDLNGGYTLEFLRVLHRHHLTAVEWCTDPESPHCGDVEVYEVHTGRRTAAGQTSHRVHASRLITFQGVELGDTDPHAHTGWGGSVLDQVADKLKHDGMVEEAGARATMQRNTPIIRIAGLLDVLRTSPGLVRQRLRHIARGRSQINAVVLDGEDSLEYHDTNLAGFADLLDRYPERVCAAAGIPRTLLYCVSPGGLNATGESDITLYYDRISGTEIADLAQPAYLQLAQMLARSQGMDPTGITALPRSLWQQTDGEKATTAKTEEETRKIKSDRLLAEVAAGVLLASEVTNALYGGDDAEVELDTAARAAQQQEAANGDQDRDQDQSEDEDQSEEGDPSADA